MELQAGDAGQADDARYRETERRRDALATRFQRIGSRYRLARSLAAGVTVGGAYAWAPATSGADWLSGILIAIVMILCVDLLPYDGLAHAFVIRLNGGRVRRLFNRPLGVFIREESGWRFVRTPRAFLDPFGLPTTASQTGSFTYRFRMSWAIVLAMSMRALIEVGLAVCLWQFTSLPAFVWAGFMAVGTVQVVMTVMNAAWIVLDQRLARPGERRSLLAERDAVLYTRAALTEGTRPSDLAATHLDALLLPHNDGSATPTYSAVTRASSGLTSAQILADCGQRRTAVNVLRQTIHVTAVLPPLLQRELYAALADQLMWLGEDTAEARDAWERSHPKSRLPYERDAYLAMVAARSGNAAEARRLAQSALKRMSSPLFRGLAIALRDDLHGLLAHLERGDVVADQPFRRVSDATT